MAHIFRDILGSMLFVASTSVVNTLPTVEELKFKILLKGKRAPKTSHENIDDHDHDDADDLGGAPHDDNDHEDPSAPPISRQSSVASTASPSVKHRSSVIGLQSMDSVLSLLANKKANKAKEVHPELSALIYLGTNKLKEFVGVDAIPADLMASFSETVTLKLLKSPASVIDWCSYNKKHLR